MERDRDCENERKRDKLHINSGIDSIEGLTEKILFEELKEE